MFFLNNSSTEISSLINTEVDETIVSLEAFQGDTALIQTVNELNNLKQCDSQKPTIQALTIQWDSHRGPL